MNGVIIIFNLFSKKKKLSPEEIMFEIEKKNNKAVKDYLKNKKLSKMTVEEEILDDLLDSLMDLFYDFAFKTKIIIIGYSDNGSFKKDLIETHNYVVEKIIQNKKDLINKNLKDLKGINTSLFLNGNDDIYEAIYTQAKLLELKNKIEKHSLNIEIFNKMLVSFPFIEDYLLLLCNNISGLEQYFKNEFR